jgi:hypothetical protein
MDFSSFCLGGIMKDLLEELIDIMEEECKGYEEWEKNKPIIVNIYIGDEE